MKCIVYRTKEGKILTYHITTAEEEVLTESIKNYNQTHIELTAEVATIESGSLTEFLIENEDKKTRCRESEINDLLDCLNDVTDFLRGLL